MRFFKLLSQDLAHYDFQYQEGLNVDTLPFDASGACRPGGLYYTEFNGCCDGLTTTTIGR
jgi:hypothetical protein